MIPMCAAFHDLCCYAKSSLTVVIPTLEVLGVEVCPLPTALLSTQTDGFERYHFEESTDSLVQILKHWDFLGLGFDAIYSGFLGSHEQVDLVRHFIVQQRARHNPLVVIDPVLGDGGKPYAPIDELLISEMRTLVREADLITPNTTEAALLLKKPYDKALGVDEAITWAKELSTLGPRYVAITSVMVNEKGSVVAYDANNDEVFVTTHAYTNISYPGCGDLFASIVTSLMVNTYSFKEAIEKANTLVKEAVEATFRANIERRQGVAIELIIDKLVRLRK